MELITRSGAVAAARATLRLHPQDDVLIARQALVPGLELAEEGVQVREPVPAGHKVAVRAIAAGAPVRRYGQIIGFARAAIAAGSHVHVHNLAMGDFAREHAFGIEARGTPAPIERSFLGIVRPDGRVPAPGGR
ncbi:UxaA family hydrolase [uncultured Pseudomonas sp.]|uniref:UxaA family hydrolase n=1 Tax=uncultured Pseudomonas sp. TaxID=114707 RepID=UPI00258B7E3A|nr:UxaA family hydrolase [uncultured Pseudomonas sp.]